MKATLGLVIAFFLIIALPGIYNDVRVNMKYQETQCVVLGKKIEYGLLSRKRYDPIVDVSYTVNQKVYHTWTSASRIYPSTNTSIYANILLDRYIVNATIPCWYDPFAPSYVVLDKQYNYNNILLAGFALTIIIVLLMLSPLNLSRQSVEPTDVDGTGGLFQIRNYAYTKEYTYRGKNPLTSDSLPAAFRKFSPRVQQYMVDKFNKNGKCVFLTSRMGRLFMTIILMFAVAWILFNISHLQDFLGMFG